MRNLLVSTSRKNVTCAGNKNHHIINDIAHLSDRVTLGSSCAIWLIEHEQVRRQIGSSVQVAAEVFEGWIGTVEPLQAWIARAAWIPSSTPGSFGNIAACLVSRPVFSGADIAATTPPLR
jgi:hypothetical protein